MDPDHRTNILTVAGFAAGVLALGALITAMLVFG
jgi:hypothetical protein